MKHPRTIYLDNAAATPLDTEVLAAMEPYLREQFYNPSAQYEPARVVRQAVENARRRVAHWLGTRPNEIIFTAGGTEANNLVIQGVMQQYPDAHLVTSAIEHESVLAPSVGYTHTRISVGADGRINPEEIADAVTDRTVLVTVQYANNEVGTVQPIREIAMILEDIRSQRRATKNELPLYLHTDACQAPAYLDVHVARLGVDFMTLNASKIYGPKQTGALYVRGGIVLNGQILGGGQERGLRSGTENVANIIGFATALELVQTRRHEETDRLKVLQRLWFDELAVAIPQVQINGSLKYRLPNNVHITIPGYDNERMMMELDTMGILCAAGSACSASNEEPSHVLRAMGLSDSAAQSSLRFTMGRMTTEADVHQVVTALTRLTA